MESIAMLRGGSLPKLPLYAPPSTICTMASWLRFDLVKPSFPQLSNGSTSVSIGSTWNSNVRDKFLTHCGNAHRGETHSDAKEDPLKSLLSLVQQKEKNSPTSTITSIKNEALKLVVNERYDSAECLMRGLCNRDEANADVAYEARVAYVQILIYLDEYNKALEFLKNESNFPQSKSSDTRPCLYKAVTHTMLGNDDDAEKWWNTFLKTLGNDNVNDKFLIHNCRNTDSEAFLFLTDAKVALKPLLSLKPTKEEENSLLSKIIPIKNMALKKMVNGEYDGAEGVMRVLWAKAKHTKMFEEAIEAQMAYVQILIHLDKYEEALKCLEDEHYFIPSDSRPCLYKAIGLTVLGNHGDAKICWDTFMQTIGDKGLPRPYEDKSQ